MPNSNNMEHEYINKRFERGKKDGSLDESVKCRFTNQSALVFMFPDHRLTFPPQANQPNQLSKYNLLTLMNGY